MLYNTIPVPKSFKKEASAVFVSELSWQPNSIEGSA